MTAVPEVLIAHPEIRAVLAEHGLDVSREIPKPLTDGLVHRSDVIVTMGCGEACPFTPGKRYEDWEVSDPSGQDLATVRLTVEDIDRRVQELVGDLFPGQPSPPSPVR